MAQPYEHGGERLWAEAEGANGTKPGVPGAGTKAGHSWG